MKRLLPLLLIVLLTFPIVSWADELEDTTNALNQKQKELQQAKEALDQAKQKESELADGLSPLQATLNTAIAQVKVKEAEVAKILAELNQEEALLDNQKTQRDIRIRALYKRLSSEKANQVVNLLDANNLVSFAKVAEYQSQALAEEERLILELDQKVDTIDQRRAELQAELDKLAEERRLAQQKVDNLQYQINLARNQQYSANSQIANLNKDIQGLTQKQQQILAAKAAANNVGGSLGDSAPTSYDPAPPSSPDQKYAFASYGVPHRVGMSQYGAYGRAQAGQNYKQILNAYFHNVTIGTHGSVPSTINVHTYGNMSLEDRYLVGIHEMPRSWSMEALKAQAVASRSYAVANLDRIANTPPNQLAQVYHPDDPAHGNHWDQRWYQAIQETRGIIVIQNNAAVSAYFSSTAGGITQQSGQVWLNNLPFLKVAEDCNGNWPNNCYDSISPWFHKPWGDRTGKTETSTGNNCQSCNPWLTKAEMVDLFNIALLHQQHNGSFNNVGVDVAPVGSGGSSHEAIRSKVNGPVTGFSTINVYQNKSIGQTGTVQLVGTNRGIVNIPAASVFAAVNVRAPGSIYLNSKLFDVIYP